MKTVKEWRGGGIQIDADWLSHRAGCEDCRQFDESKPATAAVMCLEGAVLYKRDNKPTERRERVEKPDTYASKAQVKAAMRYKE